MSGLSLKTAASFFRDDAFSVWNHVSNTFENDFQGRLFRIDRFKTIYDRPTKRQKFTYDDTVSLNGVLAVRRESDQAVFLLSATPEAEYWDGVQNYDNVVTVHRAMPPSGGQATYLAAETRGSDDDLGPVELLERGTVYLDVELRSAEDEPTTAEVMVPLLNMFFTSNVAPFAGDYFLLQDKYFLIQVVEFDSGFSFCRARQQDPTYRTGIYFYLPDRTASYDPATSRKVKPVPVEREFSFISGMAAQGYDNVRNTYNNTSNIYVFQKHLGFTPKLGDKVSTFGNVSSIEKIEFSPIEKQWKLTISG